MLHTTGPTQVTADTWPNKPQSTPATDGGAGRVLCVPTPSQRPRPPPGPGHGESLPRGGLLSCSTPSASGTAPRPFAPQPLFAGQLSQTTSLLPAGWPSSSSCPGRSSCSDSHSAAEGASSHAAVPPPAPCRCPGKQRAAGLCSAFVSIRAHTEKRTVRAGATPAVPRQVCETQCSELDPPPRHPRGKPRREPWA